MKEAVWRLRNWIEDSEHVVFFGGAGVAKESGIPDYRSEDADFAKNNQYGRLVEEMLNIQTLYNDPEAFYRFFKENMIHLEAKPSEVHELLVQMENYSRLDAVITQNTDGLYQQAGCQHVVELYGSVYDYFCMQCGKRYSINAILGSNDSVPHCKECGGIIRPNVVLYGEDVAPAVRERAKKVLAEADLLIVSGSNLAVYPIAELLQDYKGDHLALINESSTAYDRRANLAIYDNIAKTMKDAVTHLRFSDEFDAFQQ